MKYCPKCKTKKEDAEFYVDKKRGLSGWCKCCLRAYNRAKYLENGKLDRRARYLADGRPYRTTDVAKPKRVVLKERYRQNLIVKYGLAVVEAMEALDD